MKILEVLAHPNPKSFNHAIAETVLLALQEDGHEVFCHDLYAEAFNPVLPVAELAENAELEPPVARYCDELRQAEGIIIIHPNWWNQPPAILKGWVDRVFRTHVAFRYPSGTHGEGIPQCLLDIEHTLIFNTADTPPEQQRVYGDPLEGIWSTSILNFCGVHHVERRVFAPLITSTPEQRQEWLEEVRNLVKLTFPAPWRATGAAPGWQDTAREYR